MSIKNWIITYIDFSKIGASAVFVRLTDYYYNVRSYSHRHTKVYLTPKYTWVVIDFNVVVVKNVYLKTSVYNIFMLKYFLINIMNI